MEESKKCPYCGEEIKAIAKKCRFCGKWLNVNQMEAPSQPVSQKPIETHNGDSNERTSKLFSRRKIFSIGITTIGIIMVIALMFLEGYDLVVIGYLLACYGVSEFLMSCHEKRDNIKLTIIQIGVILDVICLFIICLYNRGYSFSFDYYIIYHILCPLALGAGVCAAIYSMTLRKSKK